MKLNFVPNKPINCAFLKWEIELNGPFENGVLVQISKNDNIIILATKNDQMLEVSLLFNVNKTPLKLIAICSKTAATIKIISYEYKVALFVDGVLYDEEWPFGFVDFNGAHYDICNVAGCISNEVEPEYDIQPDVIGHFKNANGWKPEGLNTRAGDCMPFAHDDVFHLFYLLDRRGHKSSWGYGGHQWAHISSKDLVNWDIHPMAIKIDEPGEGSICTGSVAYYNGIYYAFYAVRMFQKPAKLTWATSTDGIHFKKSNKSFGLNLPYDVYSARDPKVIKGEDGTFHMLITARLIEGENRKGCLAHFVSNDLEKWIESTPLVISDISEEPECCDYFYKNGLYYLVYSNFGVASYFYSKNAFGPWESVENNVIVDKLFRVPKMTMWGKDRIIFVGFRAEIDGDYAGRIYFYEAIQNEDGSLKFVEVEEMK